MGRVGYRLRRRPSGPPAATATYWRIYCDNANGGSRIGIGEIEFRATAGGADLVPGLIITNNNNAAFLAIRSSDVFGSADAWRAFANDGSTSGWQSQTNNVNEWVGIHFAALVSVVEVAITCAYFDATHQTKDMHLQYSSDGVTWTTQKNFATQTGWALGEVRVLAGL